MKNILKYGYMTLAALVAVAFSACTDEYEYDPTSVSGQQVYFSNELASTIEISPDASSFTIPLNRVDKSSALTVPLTVTAGEGNIFTFPAEVSFAAGESETSITVGYDPADIDYGNYVPVTIQIGNAEYTTVYGHSSYSFNAGVTAWSDWKPWNSTGTATYLYSQFFSGDDPELPFSYQSNSITPNLVKFQIEHCLYDVTLEFIYNTETDEVTLEPQTTGYYHSSYEEDVYVTDYNNYFENIRGGTPGVDFDLAYGEFDEEQGIIAIPVVYYISAGYFGAGYEYVYIDGYTRADVSCSVAYAGKFFDVTDKPSVVARVSLGSDVTSANVALVPGELTEDIFNEIVAGNYQPLQVVTASGEVKFDASELADGPYTFVVVSFLDGEAQNYDAATFKYQAVASAWTPLGTGLYTEDCLLNLFSDENDNPLEPITYEVEIEESTETPGLYRLVNPYGAAFPYNEEGDWDDSRDWYVEVNATDPTAVYIEAQETGLDWGYGMFIIQSLGSYYLDQGYSVEEIKEDDEDIFGTLDGGVITFPVDGLLTTLVGTGTFDGNQNGEAAIVLPSAVDGKSHKAIRKNHQTRGAFKASSHKVVRMLAPKTNVAKIFKK